MPWFNPELDDDLKKALDELGVRGGSTLDLTWMQDDILDTRLTRQFDLIFDRGCFHVLAPERRQDYVRIVGGLLKPGGYLFLKCFSRLQPGEQGPFRFTPEQIREVFGSRLNVLSVKETVYQGTLDPLPRALFCIMQEGIRNISQKGG